jgi:hypothetical protein
LKAEADLDGERTRTRALARQDDLLRRTGVQQEPRVVQQLTLAAEQFGDESLVDDLLPTLHAMVDHHIQGTGYHIGPIRPMACSTRGSPACSSRGWTPRSVTGS